MSYIINSEECVSCGACAEVCPVEAISQPEADGPYWIDPEKCTSCGACESECPTSAISEAE